MNAPEWNAMTDCPELEDLAAFHDGRLTEADRVRVLEHVATCGNCQDILVGLDAYAHGEIERTAADDGAVIVQAQVLGADGQEIVRAGGHAMTELPSGNVVTGMFGRRTLVPAVAAAAVAVFAFLSTRPTGMEKLVAAAAKVDERPIAARLSADFQYRDHRTMRGDGDKDPRLDLEAAALDVVKRTESSSSAKDRHAAGVALLLLEPEYHDGALKALQEAASKRPNDPAILTDLAAAYCARNNFNGALDAADRALAIEQTPSALWNRALALDGLGKKKEAIAAWNQYLQVDPNSAWASEVRREHLDNVLPISEPRR